MKLSEAAKKVIALADARRNYWDAELPKRHPDYPIVHEGEDSGPPPPEEAKLHKLLSGLPVDMVYQLLFILHLGKRWYGLPPDVDLEKQFEELKNEFPEPEEAVSCIMDDVWLADNLLDGLDYLSRKQIDVNQLLTKPTASRK